MSVEISQHTLSRLDDDVIEIKLRALATIEAKFRIAGPNLEELDVNAYELVKCLLEWLQRKPVTDAERVLQLLIALLNSKYKLQVIPHVNSEPYKDKLKQIGRNLIEHTERKLFKDFLRIISDYLDREAFFINPLQFENMSVNENRSMDDILLVDDGKRADLDVCQTFRYTNAWDMPGPSDLNSLISMNTSLDASSDEDNIEHALKFFNVKVNDYPAEYFLQPPFIFLSMIKLIDTKETVHKADVLNAVLELTKSLARRITVRRLAKTYIFREENKKGAARKQVTIATFCMHTFQTVLSHLQEVYDSSKLDEINLCLMILSEIVDLICLEAQPSLQTVNAIDTLLQELGLFLKYIRETPHAHKLNKYRTNRNNCIVLLYIMCRLVMYKDAGKSNATNDGADASNRAGENTLRSISIDQTSESADEMATWCERHAIDESVWRKEMELAVLDYPLKHFYPEVHELLLTTLRVDQFESTTSVKVLLNAEGAFKSAIELLKDIDCIEGEQLFAEGLKAYEVFSIIRSGDLVVKLFTEISNLASKFDGNQKLRKRGEELLLRLFSHESNDLKGITYRLAAEKMAHFFSCLMDGSTFISKSYATNGSKNNILGLPLTIDILIEIICFGLGSTDPTISSNAEKIITLILRSKTIIPHYWDRVCEILVPVLGLLQCYVRRKYALGDLILQLSDPDDDVQLPKVQLIAANVRLLFNREMRIREEAILRLSYILQSDPDALRYIPNIDNISDLLPNNICIADHVFDPERNQFGELYEQSYIAPMVRLLTSPDVEPSIRRTTLIQLNVMLQDPAMANYFYNSHGLDIILDTLRESLLITTSHNYADNVIPIVGILAKLCLLKPKARRTIADDADAYMLLLRALLINHHNDVFKMDCAIVLFSAAFAEFALGSNQVSLPILCQKLLVPFKCASHWRSSSFSGHSPLEHLLLQPSALADSVEYSVRNATKVETTKRAEEKRIFWEFARMCFADLWFGSLEEAMGVKQSGGSAKPLNYATSNNNKSLAFNSQLCLNDGDLQAIENSWPAQGISHWTKCLQNATSHEQVALACAAIENFSSIDSTNTLCWEFPLLFGAIERYADVAPKGDIDEQMFRSVIHLLRTLIERGIQNVIEWLWRGFNKANNVFLDILCKDRNKSLQLYVDNVQLIEIAISRFVQCGHELLKPAANKMELRVNQEEFRQFFERMFEMVNTTLDETFKKRDLDKLYVQLSLLRVITGGMQIQFDDYTASFLAKKLLRFITAIKSLAQAGSNFNKNCLLTIGNVMLSVDELKLDPKHLNLLSGLCGHTDFEIRAFSWCILGKVANTIRGAEMLIRELSNLPGGFHACCLSTMLDTHEPSIVRENAAYTFATLISYTNERKTLCERVYPQCAASDNVSDEFTIFRIIKQHNFYRDLLVALKNFCPTEIIQFNETIDNLPLTSCDLVRSFSVVLASIAGLNSRLDSDFLVEIAIEIMHLVPFISTSVNNSSVLLLTEICTFLSHYLLNNRELLDRVAAQEVYLIRSLVSLLDVSLYENIPKEIKTICWSQIMTLLRLLVRASYGFRTFCTACEEKPFGISFYFLLNALGYPPSTVATLKLCTTLLIISQLDEYDFATFANQLDSLFVDEALIKHVNAYGCDDDEELDDYKLLRIIEQEKKYASAILFEYWNDVFQRYKCKAHVSGNVFKAMEALLKCSHLARTAATDSGFLAVLIDDLEQIHSELGMTCTEYIRRHGNSKLERELHRIKLHFNIILSWYSMDILTDTTVIPDLLKVFIRFWPWVNASYDALLRFMKMLSILCDDSLPVCKAMTSVVIGNSQSMLQMIAEYCSSESCKVKNPQTNLEALSLALRVVSNCCSCFEGRNQINKMNMLQTLSRLHPYVTKQQKQWNKVLLLWLRFFEIFTRYPDINSGIKHLALLRTLVEQGQHELGICALEIIRNMAFNVANRTSLLASDDFLYTMKLALDTSSTAVQLLAVTSIWKLMSQNYKGRHVIKNCAIYQKIIKLNEKLKRNAAKSQSDDDDEENREDLLTALEYVTKILLT